MFTFELQAEAHRIRTCPLCGWKASIRLLPSMNWTTLDSFVAYALRAYDSVADHLREVHDLRANGGAA